MCLLFSRQPRERFSSAAPLTLSPPEGSRAGSPQSQEKKTTLAHTGCTGYTHSGHSLAVS